ncbi:MAG: Beta-galactosidase C-terminal domain [Anaerolineae bacterium]
MLGVEVAARDKAGRRFLFLLNHTGESQSVPITGSYRALLADVVIHGSVPLAPYDVVILETDLGA